MDAQHARTIFDAQHARAIFDAQPARAIFDAQQNFSITKENVNNKEIKGIHSDYAGIFFHFRFIPDSNLESSSCAHNF